MKAFLLMAATLILTFASSSQSDIYERALKREAQELNLKNLSESNARDEVRLWVGFGLITPRCFVLKSEGGIEKATYYSTEPNPAETVRPKRGVKVVLPLKTPKSGWNHFRTFLKDNGVAAPLRLTSDSDSLVDPDGEAIVIEVRSPRGYEMVFFPTTTKTPDGRKALGVCQKIESEFSVRMGC